MAQHEMFGSKGEKAINMLNEIRDVSPPEARIAGNMLDAWTGKLHKDFIKAGHSEKFTNLFTGFEFFTKILCGLSAIPQMSQSLISTYADFGWYRGAKGTLRLLAKAPRRTVLESGAYIPTAAQAMSGYENVGLLVEYMDKFNRHHPFGYGAKMNQAIAASTAEGFIRDMYSKYQKHKADPKSMAGKRAAGWLNDLGIDKDAPLTKNATLEGMYRYASDSQLMRSATKDPLFFNSPYGKPFVLFKRFTYRQMTRAYEVAIKKELETYRNPLPLLRYVAGGVIGGEFVIWAKNGISSFLSGQPVYRKEDELWKRAINDVAASSSFGLFSDIFGGEDKEAWAKTLVRGVTPVLADELYKLGEDLVRITTDWDKYDNLAIALRLAPADMAKHFGSIPRYLAGRYVATEKQQQDKLEYYKSQESATINDLFIDGKIDEGLKRVSLWNNYYPGSPMGVDIPQIYRKKLGREKY
jgi:hypothetical protein